MLSRSFDLTVLSLPRFIINLLPPDCLPILTVLFQCCTRKVYFSLLFLVISTFALLMYFSILKWKNSRTHSLLINGYPATLVDSCIKSFLDKMYNSRDKVHTCSTKVIYFCLPFTGHHGLQIRSQLQKFLSSAYPHIPYMLSFVLLSVFRTSFHLRTKLPVN